MGISLNMVHLSDFIGECKTLSFDIQTIYEENCGEFLSTTMLCHILRKENCMMYCDVF